MQEDLEKKGYIVIGHLDLSISSMTTITLTEGQVRQTSSMQQRHDKFVLVRDRVGQIGKASAIMFGYNKKGIVLADGDYVSADELLEALEKEISNLESGTKIVTSKGKVLEPEKLLEVVRKTAGAVIIRDKVEDRNAYHWSVKGAGKSPEYKKGVAFVGNKVQLSTGDYLNLDELLEALNDYVVVKPKEKEIPLEEKKIDRPVVVKVTRKYKNKAFKWLIFLTMLATLLSGIRISDNLEKITTKEQVNEQVVKLIKENNLSYLLEQIDLDGLDLDEAIFREILSDFNMGDYATLENGDTLTTQGNLTGTAKTIGKEFALEGKEEGKYAITGIAIVYNGKVIEYIESFNLEDQETNLAKYIEQACLKHNVSLEDVLITVHMGSNIEQTRAGWIDAKDLFDTKELSDNALQKIAQKGSTYSGVIEDFTGDVIILDNDVKIKITDEDGHFLLPNSVVIGSDGKKYIISDLQVDPVLKEDKKMVTHDVEYTKVINKGKKITWKVEDCELMASLLPLVTSLGVAIANKKKNDAEKQKGQIYSFQNEQDFVSFRNTFIQNGERYHQKSRFSQMLKRVFVNKEIDIMQKLTEEEIRELYNYICHLNTLDYHYNSNDHITMKDGHIYAEKIDGEVIDITDLVRPYIAQLGNKNKVEAEGRLRENDYESKHR